MSTSSEKALRLALEVLKNTRECDAVSYAIKAIEEVLAKQSDSVEHLKPLTDEQKIALCKQFPDSLTFDAIAAIEAAHGIRPLDFKE